MNMRQPISSEEKNAISFRLMYQFLINSVTIGILVSEVCKVIYHCLKDEYLKMPPNNEEWENIAEKCYNRWRFPNAFAAADGKQTYRFISLKWKWIRVLQQQGV